MYRIPENDYGRCEVYVLRLNGRPARCLTILLKIAHNVRFWMPARLSLVDFRNYLVYHRGRSLLSG